MRLIDADWLLKLVCGRRCGCNPYECGCEYHECEIGAYIKESPTVDAVEVVHLREEIKRALLLNTDETKYRYELGKMCVEAFLDDCIKYAKMDGEMRNDDE